jgi:hypothetical protein
MIKISFKNSFKNIKEVFDKDKSKIFISPFRDWSLLLFCFFISLIAVGVASFYFFIQINKEQVFSMEMEVKEEVEILDVEKLKSTIKIFDEKQKLFDELSQQKPDIIDPAL